jgi:hypothetical protein
MNLPLPPLTPQQEREVERVRKILLAPAAPAEQTMSRAAGETNFVPLPPVHRQNGTKFDADSPASSAKSNGEPAAESSAREGVAPQSVGPADEPTCLKTSDISYRGPVGAGTEIECPSDAEPDDGGMQGLIRRALAQSKRGRPAAFDDHARGKLVALLALGLSVRQSATILGVSHPTILRTMAADPELREEITAARYQAQLQPLGCVIREAQRSWRAATWLLKYMDGKLAGREETPEENTERVHREIVENQIRYEEREAARLARERTREKAREAERMAERRAEVEAMFPRRKRKPKVQAQSENSPGTQSS